MMSWAGRLWILPDRRHCFCSSRSSYFAWASRPGKRWITPCSDFSKASSRRTAPPIHPDLICDRNTVRRSTLRTEKAPRSLLWTLFCLLYFTRRAAAGFGDGRDRMVPVSLPARRRPVRWMLLPCLLTPGCPPIRTSARRTSARPGSFGVRRALRAEPLPRG